MKIPSTRATRLRAEHVTAGYGEGDVLHDVSLAVPDAELTVLVGPNGCGKSTLLKTLARLVPVRSGRVLLDEKPIGAGPAKAVARQLAMLPQSPVAPPGTVVADLVARGRYPHQGLFRQWSPEDAAAVAQALAAANVSDLAQRTVDELSGGQRQRVWIAMTLAQQTPIVLLDEPTTYLDISHQLEVLDLARRMQREGRTVVAVLHDLHLAFRYATHLVVMKDGRVVTEGAPADVVTAERVGDVFDVPCRIVPDPETGTPMVIPLVAAPAA